MQREHLANAEQALADVKMEREMWKGKVENHLHVGKRTAILLENTVSSTVGEIRHRGDAELRDVQTYGRSPVQSTGTYHRVHPDSP